MKKLLLFILLFILIAIFIDSIKQNSKKPDNLLKLSKLLALSNQKQNFNGTKVIQIGKEILILSDKLNNKNAKITGLYTLAFGYDKLGQPKKSLQTYHKLLNLSQKENNLEMIALSSIEIGNALYFYNCDYKKAISYYKNAIKIFRQTKNLYGEAKVQNNSAEILLKIGDYKNAIKLYTESLSNLEKLGTSKLKSQLVVIGNIALVTCLMGNLDVAKEYIDKYSTLLNTLNNNPPYKVKLFSLKSEFFFQEKKYEQALYWIDKALILQRTLSKKLSLMEKNRLEMKLLCNKIKILLLRENHRNIYQLISELETKLKQTSNYYIQGKFLYCKAIYYHKINKPHIAITIGNKCIDLCKTYSFFETLIKMHQDLSTWYMELNQPELSLKCTTAKNKIVKENISSRTSADIMSIILKYEQKKISNKIGKLKRFTKRIVYFSFIVIIFVSFIIYKLIVYLKKTNKKNLGKQPINPDEKENSNIIKKEISKEKTKEIMEIVINALSKDKLFLDSDLSLDSLCETLNINHYYLSKAINDNWGNNFVDLVNSFRIEEAKKILSDTQSTSLKIIEIAFQVGFNSKSTFNRVFKNKTNLTPKEYRETQSL